MSLVGCGKIHTISNIYNIYVVGQERDEESSLSCFVFCRAGRRGVGTFVKDGAIFTQRFVRITYTCAGNGG